MGHQIVVLASFPSANKDDGRCFSLSCFNTKGIAVDVFGLRSFNSQGMTVDIFSELYFNKQTVTVKAFSFLCFK
jgi:hypothetical protein